MSIDIKKQREKRKRQKPSINIVPFIDILFTLLIFIIVTSNIQATTDATGKPNATDTTGDAEYYLFPVVGLEQVLVNGQDMSHLIYDHSIAIQTRVMDEGNIEIKSSEGQIIITTPTGIPANKAVKNPKTLK